MINKSAVSSYRKFLQDRIEELIKAHATYKQAETENSISEQHAMGLNSFAAAIWDSKTSYEAALQVFDMEFGSTEKPYRIVSLHLYSASNPEITVVGRDNSKVTFEMQRVENEPGTTTIQHLLDRADKFYELSILDEEVTDLIGEGKLLIDGEQVHPNDIVALAFPE